MPNFVVFGKENPSGNARFKTPSDTLKYSDGTNIPPNAHKNSHKSGGTDSFTSGDVLDLIGRKLTNSGGGALELNATLSGDILSNDGVGKLVKSSVAGAGVGLPEFTPDGFLAHNASGMGTYTPMYLGNTQAQYLPPGVMTPNSGRIAAPLTSTYGIRLTNGTSGLRTYIEHVGNASGFATFQTFQHHNVGVAFGVRYRHYSGSSFYAGFFQLGDANITVSGQGFYFRQYANENLKAVTFSGAQAFTTDTGIQLASGGNTLRVQRNSGRVLFYVDGVEVANHITGIHPHYILGVIAGTGYVAALGSYEHLTTSSGNLEVYWAGWYD